VRVSRWKERCRHEHLSRLKLAFRSDVGCTDLPGEYERGLCFDALKCKFYMGCNETRNQKAAGQYMPMMNVLKSGSFRERDLIAVLKTQSITRAGWPAEGMWHHMGTPETVVRKAV
jgi:hypothetical protein